MQFLLKSRSMQSLLRPCYSQVHAEQDGQEVSAKVEEAVVLLLHLLLLHRLHPPPPYLLPLAVPSAFTPLQHPVSHCPPLSLIYREATHTNDDKLVVKQLTIANQTIRHRQRIKEGHVRTSQLLPYSATSHVLLALQMELELRAVGSAHNQTLPEKPPFHT